MANATLACQEVNIFPHQMKNCRSAEGKSICDVEVASVIKINPFKKDACLTFRKNDSTPVNARLRWQGLRLLCDRASLMHTRNVQQRIVDSKRCPHMGSCSGNKCADINETSMVPELANAFPLITHCIESCGGPGCDCFHWSSGCLLYRIYAVPKDVTVYELFKCFKWKEEVKLRLEISDGRSLQTYVLYIHPNVPTRIKGLEETSSVLSAPPLPVLDQTFITSGNHTAFRQERRIVLQCPSKGHATPVDLRADCSITCFRSTIRSEMVSLLHVLLFSLVLATVNIPVLAQAVSIFDVTKKVLGLEEADFRYRFPKAMVLSRMDTRIRLNYDQLQRTDPGAFEFMEMLYGHAVRAAEQPWQAQAALNNVVNFYMNNMTISQLSHLHWLFPEVERIFSHLINPKNTPIPSRPISAGGAKAVCENNSCPLQGVFPKRCRIMKRTTVHHLDIAPQLSLILERVLPSIISVHREIHHGQGVERVERSETHSFPKYQRLIEMRSDFEERKINILLTINFDGVKFKKLSRSEAWPIYIRLEGLPFKEKNKFENVIMAGITFTRKPPTEQLLTEIFSRLRQELIQLRESGIPVVNENDDCTWLCTPILANGVIDFGALKTLYDLPRWQSLHGCHLCTFPGERAGHRMIWFPRFPFPGDRRTFTTSSSQGMRGRTQMMDILSLNNCIPDALHVISEGITCDLFKAMFSVHSRVAVMKIRSECLQSFHHIIATTRNYTYASKFILGIEDLPCTTGSEKDALSFVAFPLAAALNVCAEPFLWYAIEPTLFTLKVHCLIDHAILEDLCDARPPIIQFTNA
ncbi:hypothetical protein GCK32_009862 [Trichostrongylus colubriformis]|uniref:Phlebovirus glycoprotein G2 fusion domain-containing protein n=1 Tax=Trichostrongylus colubriformis TaxID=6319 RepID=A0AAN8F033_TRICO